MHKIHQPNCKKYLLCPEKTDFSIKSNSIAGLRNISTFVFSKELCQNIFSRYVRFVIHKKIILDVFDSGFMILELIIALYKYISNYNATTNSYENDYSILNSVLIFKLILYFSVI